MKIDALRFREDQYRASDLYGRFMASRLRAIYQGFGGDVVLCLVLGEIASHNVGRYFEADGRPPRPETALQDIAARERILRPCNALSIAESTGIPRETVRRKVALLRQRGWVHRNPRGYLYVTSEVAERFADMTLQGIEELLATAEALSALLGGRPATGDVQRRR